MSCRSLGLATRPWLALWLAFWLDRVSSFALRARAALEQQRATNSDDAVGNASSLGAAALVVQALHDAKNDAAGLDASATPVPFVSLSGGLVAAAAQAAAAFAGSEVGGVLRPLASAPSVPPHQGGHDTPPVSTPAVPPLPPREDEVPLLLVGITTAPGNFDRRADVRASWMRDPLLQPSSQNRGEVQARFVVGLPSTDATGSEVAERLAAEQSEFGDILQLPVPDTYDALTNKTLAFFRWFAYGDGAGPRARFVMKIDDDTFPHLLPMTLRLHQEDQMMRYSYMGYFHECAAVKRAGRNAEALKDFSESFFPIYAAGSGYVLSAALAHELAFTTSSAPSGGPEQRSLQSHFWSKSSNVSQLSLFEDGSGSGSGVEGLARPHMLHNEDASVGLWIDDWAQRRFKEDESVQVDFVSIPATLFGCVVGDVLSMNLAVGQMRCMWEKRVRNADDICCNALDGSSGVPTGSDGIAHSDSTGGSGALLQTGTSLDYRRVHCESAVPAGTPEAPTGEGAAAHAISEAEVKEKEQALAPRRSRKASLQLELEQCCSRGVAVESSPFPETSARQSQHAALAQLLLVCAAKCPEGAAAFAAASAELEAAEGA